MNATLQIDTTDLLNKENSRGIKTALGIREGEDYVVAFGRHVAKVIEESVQRFENVKMVNVNVFDEDDLNASNDQEGVDPELDDQPVDEDSDDQKIKYSEFVDGLLFRISDGLFSIKEKQNEVVRIIINSDLKKDFPELDQIDIATEVGTTKETIEWVEINKDFLIEYLDSENNKQLYIYGGQN